MKEEKNDFADKFVWGNLPKWAKHGIVTALIFGLFNMLFQFWWIWFQWDFVSYTYSVIEKQYFHFSYFFGYFNYAWFFIALIIFFVIGSGVSWFFDKMKKKYSDKNILPY